TRKSDLNVTRSQIRADEITRDKARVAEWRVAVTVALLVGKTECRIHAGVVHHLPRAGVEILHLVEVGTPDSTGLERLEQRIASRENIFPVGMRKIRKSVVAGGHIERRKTARQVALPNETPRAVQRNESRKFLRGRTF